MISILLIPVIIDLIDCNPVLVDSYLENGETTYSGIEERKDFDDRKLIVCRTGNCGQELDNEDKGILEIITGNHNNANHNIGNQSIGNNTGASNNMTNNNINNNNNHGGIISDLIDGVTNLGGVTNNNVVLINLIKQLIKALRNLHALYVEFD